MRSPQPCDIILSHGHYKISKIIRQVTHSYWNHAGLYIGNNKVIEARMLGVVESGFRYKGKDTLILRAELTPMQRVAIVKYALSQLGKRYDYFQLLSLLFLWLFKRGRVQNSKNHFICSELVASAFYDADISLCNKPIELITPADLEKSKLLKKVT